MLQGQWRDKYRPVTSTIGYDHLNRPYEMRPVDYRPMDSYRPHDRPLDRPQDREIYYDRTSGSSYDKGTLLPGDRRNYFSSSDDNGRFPTPPGSSGQHVMEGHKGITDGKSSQGRL